MQLERNKQIDAVCDRFELAWNGRTRPRIEEFLELHAAADRRLLLEELLASELALRARQQEVCDLDEYERRFPQDRDIVAAVFKRHRPKSTRSAATVPPAARCIELIQAVRSRLQPAGSQTTGSQTAIYGNQRSLRSLANQLSPSSPQDIGQGKIPPERELWLGIIQTAGKMKALDLEAMESVIRDLLEAFSPARRALLIDALLGQSSSQTAQANHVTERTVANTVGVATKLLQRANE